MRALHKEIVRGLALYRGMPKALWNHCVRHFGVSPLYPVRRAIYGRVLDERSQRLLDLNRQGR